MKTAVVILNHNTEDYLRRFLPALLASCEDRDAQVWVADNASSDGSVELLERHFPEVPVLLFDKNFGFTGGYNKALAQIEAEYFVLINSDVEVTPDWLRPLTEWMDSHPDCGACGPKLRSFRQRDRFEYAGAAGGLIDRYGYPFCRGRLLKQVEKDEGQYDTPASVLWVSGACLMVRASLWKSLGGLDERFFAHMEEIDLCWRMQLLGWKVQVVPDSCVYHVGGGTLSADSPLKLKLNYRNNLLLLENNLPATFAARGFSPEAARRRARRRIAVRRLLDAGSALVYLLSGRWSGFSAVVAAQREYRRLRRSGNIPPSPVLPDGISEQAVVLRALLGKKPYICKR